MLGIILPSNNPDAFFNHFGWSVDWIASGINVKMAVLLVAQPPWTPERLRKAKGMLNASAVELRSTLVAAADPPFMCGLRQLGASLAPNANIYMLADDNMEFVERSGEKYRRVMEYMAQFPKCGLVQCHRTPSPDGYDISPTDNGLITTNKGLFIRNVFLGEPWPEETWGFKASLEETVAGYRVLEEGFYPARQFDNPTKHSIHKIDSDQSLHSGALIDANAGRWVRERYRAPDWRHEAAQFPPLLKALAVQRGGTASVSFTYGSPRFTTI